MNATKNKMTLACEGKSMRSSVDYLREWSCLTRATNRLRAIHQIMRFATSFGDKRLTIWCAALANRHHMKEVSSASEFPVRFCVDLPASRACHRLGKSYAIRS